MARESEAWIEWPKHTHIHTDSQIHRFTDSQIHRFTEFALSGHHTEFALGKAVRRQ